MSKPYKLLQNKALHKGLRIAYVKARGDTWTTNGHVMVRAMISPLEVKPLKDQVDLRGVTSIPDVDFILDKLEDVSVRADVEKEWTTEAGLTLLQTRALNRETNEEYVANIQAIYADYINARFDVKEWRVTPGSVYAVDQNDEVVAVIALVDEEYKGEEDELGHK